MLTDLTTANHWENIWKTSPSQNRITHNYKRKNSGLSVWFPSQSIHNWTSSPRSCKNLEYSWDEKILRRCIPRHCKCIRQGLASWSYQQTSRLSLIQPCNYSRIFPLQLDFPSTACLFQEYIAPELFLLLMTSLFTFCVVYFPLSFFAFVLSFFYLLYLLCYTNLR